MRGVSRRSASVRTVAAVPPASRCSRRCPTGNRGRTVTASLRDTEGTTGAALLAAENLLRPAALQLWLADGTPVGAAARLHPAA